MIDAGGGVEFVEAPVQRHAGAEARIRSSVQAFWNDVDAGRQPKMDPARDSDVISGLYPRSDAGRTIDLGSDQHLPRLLARRARRKAYIKAAEDEIQTIETDLKAKIGSHEAASVPGWRVTWKTQSRAERLTPSWEGRVLRITPERDAGATR